MQWVRGAKQKFSIMHRYGLGPPAQTAILPEIALFEREGVV